MDEVMRHFCITLALVCELNSVNCSSGSKGSLTTGHMSKILTHSIFGTAFTLMIIFIAITLTHGTSLSSKLCPPFLQSLPLKITSDAKVYPPDHRRPRWVPARHRHECQLPNQLLIYAPMDRYPEKQIYLGCFSNNNDVTFMDLRLPKPANLLLHYNQVLQL